MTRIPPTLADGRAEQPRPDEPSSAGSPDRIASLRGATVQFNPRRVMQVITAVVITTLLAVVVILTVAGVHTNDQIDTLHERGVPVTVTVTGCLGLLGGSGSNAAGYSCHGAYTLGHQRFVEALPGTDFHRPGSTISAVAVPGDPALLSPTSIVDSQHSSAGVFVVPAVLTGVLLLLVGTLAWRRRSGRRQSRPVASA